MSSIKESMREHCLKHGRKDLAHLIIGVLRITLDEERCYTPTPEEVLQEARQLLADYDELRADDTLPFTWAEAKARKEKEANHEHSRTNPQQNED